MQFLAAFSYSSARFIGDVLSIFQNAVKRSSDRLDARSAKDNEQVAQQRRRLSHQKTSNQDTVWRYQSRTFCPLLMSSPMGLPVSDASS